MNLNEILVCCCMMTQHNIITTFNHECGFPPTPPPFFKGNAISYLHNIQRTMWVLPPHLVSLLAARHGTSKGLLLPAIHAHGTEDGLGADGAFGGP